MIAVRLNVGTVSDLQGKGKLYRADGLWRLGKSNATF